MKKSVITALLLLPIAGSAAGTDYSSLEGKSGASLKQAIKAIAAQHQEISYGDATWDAFRTSDVRMIDGREAWFDMYSNRLVYVSSGHSGMNIEHAVANSWWGGTKGAAYKDLHHLNPSDADANNRKSNNPLGIIDGTPVWSNGMTRIGAPVPGIGGGAMSVFEPADEFKGDFARAYFYVFTIYDDLAWQEAPACMYDLTSYPTLRPWASEMLLGWARQDPVDSRESRRNKAVEKLQKNENPFVAIPGLAEYVWGEKKNTPFRLADAIEPIADRPEAPVFDGYELAAVNTWTGRWWDPADITLSCPDPSVRVYYSMPGTEGYVPYSGTIELPGASQTGDVLTITAYAQGTSGYKLKSPVATLTLTAVDSSLTDYKNAVWTRVRSMDEISEEGLYVVCSAKAFNIMGCGAAATASSGYVKAAGTVEPKDDTIKGLPDDSGIVQFVSDGGGLYYVGVNDLTLAPKGYLLSNTSKFLTIAPDGRGVGLTMGEDGMLKMDFGTGIGTLQYNAQSPRFSVYTSSQQGITLYKYSGGAVTGIPTGVMEAGVGTTRIFTLEGIEVTAPEEELPAGIYVKVSPSGKSAKIRVR